MGQGSSSTRCPTTGALRTSQLPSPSYDMSNTEEQQPPYSSALADTAVTPSRRRSFSPDPDSIDSRRSNRIRRRISRFVSSNITGDNASSRESVRPPSSVDTFAEPAAQNPSTFAPRVRLSRIRTGILSRRRSSNVTNLEGSRRERPFSMITPRLGSLPLHIPRETGSLDLPQTLPLQSPINPEPASDILSELPILTEPEFRTTEPLLVDHQPEALRSDRSFGNDFFGPRRNISNSRSLRPRRTHTATESFGSIAEGSQAPSESPSATPLTSSTQPRTGYRSSRGSGASHSPRLGRSGEDQAAVLSRLLSVAAAATAASLVGSNAQAFSDARDVSGDGVDGSFDSFLRALQNGRLASALRNGGTSDSLNPETSDDIISTGSIGPLNFFRMFRFGPTSTNTTDSASPDPPASGSGGEQNRMIPVIIVGIRSVNPREVNTRDGRPSPPFLDALPSAPIINDGSTRPGGMHLSHSDAATRPHSFPVLDDTGQRESDTSDSITHSISGAESSTLSDLRSTRRPRSFNAVPSDSSTTFSEASEWTANSTSSNDSRRSFPSQVSSDNLPSRSASPDSTRQPSEGTRSWIIYVLGGSYPENHPILTTPSLFTDTPTYEDMMLLSSLIAPVKPPVASREDVESAGGLFTVHVEGATENSGFDENTTVIRLNPGERCLVCLSDFESGEISRQLVKCQHVFHKDCIDEWLTTGRNSCPLCRGKGVEEGSVEEDRLTEGGTTATAS
ncbi:hypothetical protein TWF694_002779 [Orbilia ellipsospora]|uniref:RING-type domain-containing protein n=1 Tax=Orbilia ellipsospora TaxID=2528407 RepID=A0AAV9WZP4_9PEZI